MNTPQPLLDPISLRGFIAVCELGSIAAAAERLSIVPSALSKRIAALEEQLGLLLLTRTKRRSLPTAAGEALLRHARDLMALNDRALSDLEAYTQGIHGSVHVMASLSMVAQGLPDDLARFFRLHRSIRVTLEERISAEIARGVREGRAHFGICWSAVDLTGLHTQPFREDQLCVVAHPDHALAERITVSLADVMDHELINVQPGSIMESMLLRQAALLGRSLTFRLQVANFEPAIRFVAAGLGVAILPRQACQALADVLGLRLIPLTDEWATRRFVIVTRQSETPSPSARLLLSFLLREIAD